MKTQNEHKKSDKVIPATVLNTKGAVMPNPDFDKDGSQHKKMKEDAEAGFNPYPEKLPESHGDLADQAQNEIDSALEEKINSIRKKNTL